MGKYTWESLKEINESYHLKHGLSKSDVVMVNEWVDYIQNSRDDVFPQVGDIVEYTNAYGDYYKGAHVETVKEDKVYICEKPYSPFVSRRWKDGEFKTSTSGGAWTYIPKKLRYVGKREKAFVDWGHSGACANGAVMFFAKVNVWEYEKTELKYTTKTHDKFHVSIHKDTDTNDYKYIITKDMMSHAAFKTEEEYMAWLKTFNGVEDESLYCTGKAVWTLKQKEKCLPLEEYNAIEDAMVDTELCNGSIQECKRVYEGTIVTTYLPYQNDMIKMDGVKRFRNAYNS